MRSSPTDTQLGHPRVHARSLGSTNDLARELALAGAPHGTLVTADVQTAGRGRQGRSWSATAGGALLMSLLLRREAAGGLAAMRSETAEGPLTLAAGVAVSEAIGPEAQIKWPNDIVIPAGQALGKVAGILAEGRPPEGWVVVGIGVNVSLSPEELGPELSSTAATLGRPPEAREELLEGILETLGGLLAGPASETIRRWRGRDALLGREISWKGGRGTARGVDEHGRLLVESAGGGSETLDAGEVHLERG